MSENSLSERSKQVRRDTIALSKANGGYHYGGCFSATEILITLFDKFITDRDRFILSKGHACWPYYVLLRERGLNPRLSGHPSRDPANGIHCTTGSLGHGLPAGVGMALARKLRGEGGMVYVLMGDGECQEGTTWESMLIAAHHKLDNLLVVIDWNRIQGSDFVNKILPLPDMTKTGLLLGWYAISTDGHDLPKLEYALELLHSRVPDPSERPRMLVAGTVKGRGVSYMENNPKWHANWPDEAHVAAALEELR